MVALRLTIVVYLFCCVSGPGLHAQNQDTLLAHYSVHLCDSLIKDHADDPDFVVLDVRTAPEYLPQHLYGAINRDYYAGNYTQLLGLLPKHKLYLVYCATGSRSSVTYNMMKVMGFTRVVNMAGGMVNWKAAGYPYTSVFEPLLMAVSDTIIPMDTVPIGNTDTIPLTITNRANDTLKISSIPSLSGTEFSTDFDTTITLEGAEDYSFSVFYTPIDEVSDSIGFVIETNGGITVFYIFRTGKLLVGFDNEPMVPDITIYPNPASTEIYVKATGQLLPGSVVSIVDISGQEVSKHYIPENKKVERVDVSSLNAGTYIISIYSSQVKVFVRKLLIIH